MTARRRALSKALKSASDNLNRAIQAVAAGLMLLMLLAVLLQVVARYLFFSPPSWTEEFARYCMVWAGLLGATVTFHQRSDPVLMDIPAPRSRALRIAAEALRAAAVSAFVLPLLIYSPDIVSHHTLRLTESMRWPSAYVMLIVPIFSAVILIHMILRVVCKSLGGTHATDDRKPVP